MKCLLTTKIFSGQNAAIKNYGDLVWDWTCDNVMLDELFTNSRIVNNCTVLKHLEKRTRQQYVSAIISNIYKEFENDINRCPIKRINRLTHLMKSGVDY